MGTVLAVLAVLAVLFATAVLATRADPLLADAPPDRPDLELPPDQLGPDDVAGVRFSLALRGYRMSEVDAVLDRLAEELAARDCRIEELTGSHGVPVRAEPGPRERLSAPPPAPAARAERADRERLSAPPPAPAEHLLE